MAGFAKTADVLTNSAALDLLSASEWQAETANAVIARATKTTRLLLYMDLSFHVLHRENGALDDDVPRLTQSQDVVRGQ